MTFGASAAHFRTPRCVQQLQVRNLVSLTPLPLSHTLPVSDSIWNASMHQHHPSLFQMNSTSSKVIILSPTLALFRSDHQYQRKTQVFDFLSLLNLARSAHINSSAEVHSNNLSHTHPPNAAPANNQSKFQIFFHSITRLPAIPREQPAPPDEVLTVAHL